MSEQTTYIKLDRRILSWGWYKDAATFKVFVHLLLKANYKEADFMGVRIHRGYAVASYKGLAEETGLSVGQVRNAVEHLKKTGEVEVKHHRTFSVYKVVNYAQYQDCKGRKKTDPSKPKVTTNPMGVYGINSNVKLTDDEYTKLVNEYVDAEAIINKVSVWLSEGTHSKARKHYNLCVKFAADFEKKPEDQPHKHNEDGSSEFVRDGIKYRRDVDGLLTEIERIF